MKGSWLATPHDAEIEPDICWQAIRSKDRRFDGRFFVAALTTGIYCRSVCPVPFAKPDNVALFPCAAAAEAAGFRPCRRCHPETVPGSPAWLGTSAVVSRALRLIWDGALAEGSVGQLAERVGIGSRQLRRLFLQHLGVPPIKIAHTRRIHFARNLIEQTDMPMAEIALNAGFKSIRQFNHAVRTTAGQSPRQLRRVGGDCASSPRGGLAMRLLYRPPFNWSVLMAFLSSRATPGVELVEEKSYRRTIESEGRAGVIEVRPDQENDCLTVLISLPKYGGLLGVLERVRRIFDLGADPLQIAAHLSRDPRLKPLLDARPGVRIPGAWDGFEVAVRAVLGQRLEVVDSAAVARELVRSFGRPLDTPVEGLTHLFPRPEDLANADLTSFGIPRECAASVSALAKAACNQELPFESSRSLEHTVSRLRTIEGIGPQTAHYIALRSFGEPDAFPLDQPALERGLRSMGAHRVEILNAPERWRPWCAYAAMYLWAAGALEE